MWVAYLIQVQQLVPHVWPKHGAPILGQDQQPPQLSWPGDPRCLELSVVGGEEGLDDCPLLLGLSARGGEQVLGVVVVVHPLEAGGAQGCHHDGDNDEVAGVLADKVPQLVEEPSQDRVHPIVDFAPGHDGDLRSLQPSTDRGAEGR